VFIDALAAAVKIHLRQLRSNSKVYLYFCQSEPRYEAEDLSLFFGDSCRRGGQAPSKQNDIQLIDELETRMAAEFTNENFETEVLKSEQPVLVDFWATWCGPCRQLTPVIDQLAGENTDAKIGKLDVDAHQETAMKYGVTSIPTLIVFKDGEVVERLQGVQPKSKLQEILDTHKATA
jgi:thioredoxin 1